jgi:PKD repeat protein
MKKLYALIVLLFLVILSFSACTSDLSCDSLSCSSGPEPTPVSTGPCHADFYVDSSQLTGGSRWVTFYSTSTGNIQTCKWNFGTGRTGVGVVTKEFYDSNGYYTITLTIEGPDCYDVETKVDYIEVSGC